MLGQTNTSQFNMPRPNPKSGLPLSSARNFFKFGEIGDIKDPIYRPLNSFSPFVAPEVDFKRQIDAVQDDPELLFGLDFITAVSVGGGYHFTAKKDQAIDYIDQFAKDINLDYIAQTAGKEVLGFGNSLWQYLDIDGDPKYNEILKQLPLSSLKRIWWDGYGPHSQISYYEFRGFTLQRILPQELIHFRWRTFDALPFGFGTVTPLVKQVEYTYLKGNEEERRKRMSILDIKHSMQDFLHKSLRRHQRRVVYGLEEAQPGQAQDAQSSLDNLEDEQDFVMQGKTNITEIGATARAIDAESFEKLYSNEIIKSLGTPTSRLYEKGSLTEASANAAKDVALMNLNGFQRQMQRMIERLIIQPWYKANPLKDANGVIIPWETLGLELNWGLAEKPEMTSADFSSIVSQLSPSPKKEEMIYKFLNNAGVEVNTEQEAEVEPTDAEKLNLQNEETKQKLLKNVNEKIKEINR